MQYTPVGVSKYLKDTPTVSLIIVFYDICYLKIFSFHFLTLLSHSIHSFSFYWYYYVAI